MKSAIAALVYFLLFVAFMELNFAAEQKSSIASDKRVDPKFYSCGRVVTKPKTAFVQCKATFEEDVGKARIGSFSLDFQHCCALTEYRRCLLIASQKNCLLYKDRVAFIKWSLDRAGAGIGISPNGVEKLCKLKYPPGRVSCFTRLSVCLVTVGFLISTGSIICFIIYLNFCSNSMFKGEVMNQPPKVEEKKKEKKKEGTVSIPLKQTNAV